MSVKVITDSTADIPAEIMKQLDITVVPIYVLIGEDSYRDGIDIDSNDLYGILDSTPIYPITSQPNPEDFVSVYTEYADSVDGIVSIHISSGVSGTYNSAVAAVTGMESTCPIEVIDSRFNSAGLGLIVAAAARLAQSGATFQKVVEEANKAVREIGMFGMFEHMKYLARGGRINKTIAAASQFLNVMPLLTFHDGELARAGFVRKVENGMNKLYEYVKNNLPVDELVIAHSAVEERANRLRQRLGELVDVETIQITELGASLGVHGGPGVLLVAIRRSAYY